MQNLSKILNLFYKRVPVSRVIGKDIFYHNFSKQDFTEIAFAYVNEYSETEIENMWNHYADVFRRAYLKDCRRDAFHESGINVFDSLFYYVDKLLIVQNNEILCRYTNLLDWRMLTYDLSEDLLVSAFWAKNSDAYSSFY